MFEQVRDLIHKEGGILSVDDTVIEKLYSDPSSTELVSYFWSGKYHQTIKGINLITLYYSDIYGNSVPVNYRIYDKKEGKTKNDYFREMLSEVLNWGLTPKIVTGDSWYSSVENLKFLRNQKLGFLFGVESNRTFSDQPQKYRQARNIEIPEEGWFTHLKGFGFVKLFRKDFKKGGSKHYIFYHPDEEIIEAITRSEFLTIHNTHWGIESYHRAIKQVCGVGRFQVRNNEAIRTHIFCSLRAFIYLEIYRSKQIITNWYEVQKNLFTSVIREYILENLTQFSSATA